MQRTKLLEPNTFISAFRNNRSAIKLLLDTILHTSKPLTNISLTIKHTELYNSKLTRSDGWPDQSIIIYAEDGTGTQYDIDIMVADKEYFAKQARVHSSHLTVFGRYPDNNEVQEYIILFTPTTLPGCELPLAMFEWKLGDTGKLMKDGEHILIVNCEFTPLMYTPFYDMLHDLKQYEPYEMCTHELKQALLEVISQQSNNT